MIKFKIRPDLIEDLHRDENFITSIQLARMVNALYSNMRLYLANSHEDKYIQSKDRLDLILFQASIVYEAMLQFNKHSRVLSTLKFFNENKETIKQIQNEIHGNESFTNKVLKNIRRKICYHFDSDIIAEALVKVNFPKDVVFAYQTSSVTSLKFFDS